MPTAHAIVYLESEPQYTEGVTFELSLRRSSVGHRDIIREEGVTGCGGSSFGRCDTHVRLRHNGPTSTALRYDELFSAQLWDNANIVRGGSGCSCCSDMVTPFLFLSYPSTHSSSATALNIYINACSFLLHPIVVLWVYNVHAKGWKVIWCPKE